MAPSITSAFSSTMLEGGGGAAAVPPFQWHLRAMLVASAQGTALSALSNVLAQLIDPWRRHEAFVFHLAEFVRFVLVQAALQPPLFYWQMWMERRWPGSYVPTASATVQEYEAVPQDLELSDVGDSTASLEEEGRANGGERTPNPNAAVEPNGNAIGPLSNATSMPHEKKEPQASRRIWRNVWIKWALDNTFGGIWFTVVFIVLLELFRFHGPAVVWHAVLRDFIPLLLPSYVVWAPATLFNFIWIPVEKRIVFLAFVAVLWNIYLSLFAAESAGMGPTKAKAE